MADRRLTPEERQLVLARARGCCEYCRSQERFAMQAFAIEHITPRSLDGETAPPNLAVACQGCNSFKGPNIATRDSHTGKLVQLFNPRRHSWKRCFRWAGPLLVGRTPIGRATIQVLCINAPPAMAVRQSLIDEGVFPPLVT